MFGNTKLLTNELAISVVFDPIFALVLILLFNSKYEV